MNVADAHSTTKNVKELESMNDNNVEVSYNEDIGRRSINIVTRGYKANDAMKELEAAVQRWHEMIFSDEEDEEGD